MIQRSNKTKNIIDYFNRKSIYNQLNMVVFNLLGRTDIPFSLNVGGGSYTDGKKIVVGLPEIFVEKTFAYEEIYSVLKALTGHEAEHIKSSDFGVLKVFLKDVAEYLSTKFKIHQNHGVKIAKHVLNSVEDGRIEKRLCNRKKGYKKHIQFLNATLWKEQPIRKENELQDFLYSITSYSVTGLFPKDFELHYKNTRMEKELNKIKAMTIKGINESTAQGCANRCMRIIEITAPYLAELLKDEENQMSVNGMSDYTQYTCENPDTTSSENPGNAISIHFKSEEENKADSSQEQEQNEGDGNGILGDMKGEEGEPKQEERSGEANSTSESNEDSTEGEDSAENEETQEGAEGESDVNNTSKQDDSTEDLNENESKSNAISDDSIVEDIIESVRKDAMKDAEFALKNAKKEEDKQKEESKKKAKIDKGVTKKEVHDVQEAYSDKKYGKPKPTLTISPIKKRNRELTEDIKRDGKRFRKEIEEIFKNKKTYDSRHRRKGILDTSSIWKVGTKDYNVFLKKGQPQITDYVAYMLVDGSGSMMDRVDEDNNKVSCSQKACAVIEEGIKGFIPFKSTIFRASGRNVKHTIVSEFSNDSKFNESWNAYFEANGGNMDGFSIRIAIKELLQRPERNRLLVILSDGLPSAYPSQKLGQADVKDAVKEARKNGIKVVSICFGSKRHREETIDVYNDMYQKSVISCAPSDINKELTRVLKREITR
ncbi:hypothetical protein SIM22_03565 [Bacillus cereus group sp. BfR-BA-01363]|uniref:hypothetical protein n=1 Tax=Bacillus cereus group sp. BfR-BA-01363 TaxID=3094882 RepID=UPI0029C44B05|nr:hypothetical protein [Bacillus cereus group sp. BfR-BA-01363]MDX5853203.1 hypothetical protein [Bacillus cereus group sp. BfR-BA-01363]